MTHYISTRGQAPRLSFAETTLTGLARDGGLYVPEALPAFSVTDIREMADLPYKDLALRVILPFVGGDIPPDDLRKLIDRAYKSFTHPEIAPLHKFDDNFQLLELFYGPTLAFKDVALQLLGQIFDYILAKKKQRVTIVGATSGDTGSAAISAFEGRENVDIFILHPKGRVSEVQRRQMTTVLAPNVHNIAIEGSFDDCQDLVKAMFNDAVFRDEMSLSAVNSINWARILAQVVYYFYAALKIGRPVSFCVPTGNFGNIYAGYIAQKLGAPIEKLIIASNRNDILHRFLDSGEMKMAGVAPSLSPSMDIQVSSNFERLLFDLLGRDGAAVKMVMNTFRLESAYALKPEIMAQLRFLFASGRRDDAETLRTIKSTHEKRRYILDPHSAVGVGVGENYLRDNPAATVVSLATAHPAKFPAAVKEAIGIEPPLPPSLADLYQREERYDALPADLAAVQAFVRKRAKT